jgi:hypothetical protein
MALVTGLLVTLALATGSAVALPAAVNLSNTVDDSLFASLGVNGETLTVMWVEGNAPATDIFMARSLNSGVTWSVPVNLTNQPGPSEEYDWGFAGRYYFLVWAGQPGGNWDVFFERSTDGGVTFVAKNLSVNSGDSRRPRVALSGGSNVYVVWEDNTGSGYGEILFRRSMDAGATFGPVVNLSNTGAPSQEPSIIAFGPHAYVLWTEGAPGFQDVFLRHSTDGGTTFGAAVNVSATSMVGSYLPAMAIAGPTVAVVWTEGNYRIVPEIMFRASANGGATFGAATNVSNTGNPGGNPITGIRKIARAMLSGTFVLVLWQDAPYAGGSEVLFRRSTDGGGAWETAKNLSSTAAYDSEEPSWTLAGTHLSVVWIDPYPEGLPNVLYRRSPDAGKTFNSTLNLTASSFGTSQNPQIVAVGRDVFAAWSAGNPRRDIYFAKTTGGFADLPPGAGGWAGGTNLGTY